MARTLSILLFESKVSEAYEEHQVRTVQVHLLLFAFASSAMDTLRRGAELERKLTEH